MPPRTSAAQRHATPGHAMTVSDALDDPNILAPFFAGASWNRWRAISRAAEGLPLNAEQYRLFREVADRDPPRRRVRELWIKAGRRAGKDSVASAVATVASLGDYQQFLRPGERATVMCLACDRDQARIIKNYIAGYFERIPLLRPLVARVTDDGHELTNGVEIVVATNTFRAVRGRSIACVVLDECAFWRDESSATPDIETYNALVPGLVTLPGAMLIGISTPYRRAGLLFQKWSTSYGKDDPDVLVVGGATRMFNELVPQATIDDALARDHEAAASEWLAEWRSDLSDFLDRELIDAAVDRGVVVRAPQPALRYAAFADPSGGRGDSFALGIAHAEGNIAVLDCLYEKRAPFDPSVTVAEIAVLLRGYHLAEVTGDRYAASWVTEAFAKEGIGYRQSERDRSAIYLDALPLFTAGRVRLLDNARLVNQFASLERRTSRIGKDRVDHPPGGADDVANAAAGALVITAAATAPSLWRRESLLIAGLPAPPERFCDYVYATMIAGQRGECAVVFFAYNRVVSYPLRIIDCIMAPLAPELFHGTAVHLRALAASHRAARTRPLYAPEALAEEARRHRYNAEAIDALMTEENLALSAATHIAAGRVKVSADVIAKAGHMPLGGILDATGNDDDPLRIACLVGIALALDRGRSLARAA